MAEKACTKCRENCKNLATQDIIAYCRDFFEIGEEVSDRTMRERIKKEVGAEKWAAAEVPTKGKRTGFFFTQEELQQIVFETSLYDYMIERASERARVMHIQGKPFHDWWADMEIGADGYQALASKLMDLSFNLSMQVYGEGLLPPIMERKYKDEEKVEVLFETIKKALMFYPQFADMFGGESEQEAKPEDERLAERVADLVAQKLATKPQTEAEPKPRTQNKHGTFRR